MLSKNPTLVDHFKRRQRKAERLSYRRSKYEARGFFFHGPIPQSKFSNFRNPFLKRQLGRGERPNLPPAVRMPMQNLMRILNITMNSIVMTMVLMYYFLIRVGV